MKYRIGLIATITLFSCSRGDANNAAFGLGQLLAWGAIIVIAIWILKSIFGSGNKKQ